MLKIIIKTMEISFIFLMAIMMMGCGSEVKNEAELQKDLMASSLFYMPEDWEIENLSIVKRLTDKENKKDVVYVSFEAGNEYGKMTNAYTMYYTEYNDGWHLDSIEEYYGDDVVRDSFPLKGPEEDYVLEAVKFESECLVSAFFTEYEIISVPGLYYFEDGCYDYSFENVKVDLEAEIYSATLIVDRTFDMVKVHEVIDVELWFEADFYSGFHWYLASMETTDISYDWDIEGTWKIPGEDYWIKLYDYHDSDEGPYVTAEIHSTNLFYEPVTETRTIYLREVSSRQINITDVGPEKIYGLFDMEITPNGTWNIWTDSEWVRVE